MASRFVDYRDGDTLLQGYLAWNDAQAGPRPAVLVSHAWAGRDAFSCARADDLARLGYVGFALDVYGKDIHGGTVEANRALMQPLLDDRCLLRRRLAAAVTTAAAQPEVDATRIAAIGYCFGGLCVLDLARAGTELRGVVSFHGLLSPPDAIPNAEITAAVLVLHGHDDPMVPPEQVLAFEQEMSAAEADWQLHAYGNTVHSFTHPDADAPAHGSAYNPDAARRAWASMKGFLEETLA